MKLPTLRAVGFEELDALVRGLDLAELVRRDVGIEDIEPFIVGEEQRRVAAGSRRRECAAAATKVERRRRRRQIPECKPENPAPAPTSSASSISLRGTGVCGDL